MTKLPWFKFYPADWRAEPSLRMVSLEARGFWIECMCIMHEAEPYGHLMVRGVAVEVPALAAIVGTTEQIARACLHELEGTGVLSTTRAGCIYSRRMVRDAMKRKRARENGLRGGDPDLVRLREKSQGGSAGRFDRRANPTKVNLVWAACGGACSLCGVSLVFDHDNSPNAFEVDHITPLALGGTNDLENLRGVCKSCNLKEAKKSGRKLTLVSSVANHAPNHAAKLRGQSLEKKEEANASLSTLRADAKQVFEELWKLWPSEARKRHPQQKVRDAVSAQLRAGANATEIIAAGRAHVAERLKSGPSYVKGLVPWLNQGLWRNWVEQPDPAELERRRKLFEYDGTWRDEWGPKPTKGATT